MRETVSERDIKRLRVSERDIKRLRERDTSSAVRETAVRERG